MSDQKNLEEKKKERKKKKLLWWLKGVGKRANQPSIFPPRLVKFNTVYCVHRHSQQANMEKCIHTILEKKTTSEHTDQHIS